MTVIKYSIQVIISANFHDDNNNIKHEIELSNYTYFFEKKKNPETFFSI